MSFRHGETLLLTIGIPVILLIFFTEVHVTSLPAGPRVNFLAPGILGLSVMSSSMVALSIATGFERSYGVLRRLFVTPLSRTQLITAKILSVFVIEIVQVVVVSVVAMALGWRPHGGLGGVAELGGALILATSGFAGLGLILAGLLRAELNLAATNGLYLVLLLLSGFVIKVSSFPVVIRHVVTSTPSGAFANVLHSVLGAGTGFGVTNLISLGGWALVAPIVASRVFRFD